MLARPISGRARMMWWGAAESSAVFSFLGFMRGGSSTVALSRMSRLASWVTAVGHSLRHFLGRRGRNLRPRISPCSRKRSIMAVCNSVSRPVPSQYLLMATVTSAQRVRPGGKKRRKLPLSGAKYSSLSHCAAPICQSHTTGLGSIRAMSGLSVSGSRSGGWAAVRATITPCACRWPNATSTKCPTRTLRRISLGTK